MPIRSDTRRSFDRGTRPGNADVDRQARPSLPDVLDPLRGDRRVEADLADDVRRELRLLEHRLDRRLVVDERVALRIPGDPHLGERASELVERLEQVDRAVEAPARLLGVARHDEHVPDRHAPVGARRSLRGRLRPPRAARRDAARPRSRAASDSTSSSVGSSPFVGDAVTVSVTSGGTCSSTASSTPSRGSTS